jgi:tetratricopeptide (TPR) repeat protein
MIHRGHILAIASVIACVFTVSIAHAEPTPAEIDEARAFLKEGREQLAAKRYERAANLLEKAHRIMHAPTTAIELMDAYAFLQKRVEAWEIGEEMQRRTPAADDNEAYREARKKIDVAMQRLDSRIPTFVFQFELPQAANVRLFVDGRALRPEQNDKPYRINNGSHRIRAEADGYVPLEIHKPVDVPMAEEIIVPIRMTAAPEPIVPEPIIIPEPPKPAPTAQNISSPLAKPMWATFGASLGVALGTGIGAGLVYAPMEDAWYERDCGNLCESQYYARKSVLQGLSITAAVSGTVSLATLGAALWSTFVPKTKSKSSAYLVPTANGAGFVGTW